MEALIFLLSYILMICLAAGLAIAILAFIVLSLQTLASLTDKGEDYDEHDTDS